MTKKTQRWIRLLLWLCMLATAAGIFAFSAQEGPESSKLSNNIAKAVVDVIDQDFHQLPKQQQSSVMAFTTKLVRKGAHFTEFAVLGFIVRLLIGSYGLPMGSRLSWLVGTLYACTDELHQHFVSARSAMWQDVALDSLGVAAGIMVAHTLMVLHARMKKRRKSGG